MNEQPRNSVRPVSTSLAPVGEAEESDLDDAFADAAWDDALAAAARGIDMEDQEAPMEDLPQSDGQQVVVPGGEAVFNESSEEDIEPPRIIRNPKCPTAREIDEHELTHMQPRSWCRACVYGRGMSDQHRRQLPHPMDAAVPTEITTPIISIDFTFMGTSKIKAQSNPYFILYDNETGTFKSYRTRRRGVVRWVIDALIKDLESMGYAQCKICIRCDRESSLLAIRRALIRKRKNVQTVPLDVPVRESKSNGAMERAIRTWQGEFRTLKECLQLKIGEPIPINSTIAEWMSWWAAELINRVRKNGFGRTAFQMILGKNSARPLAPFGEMVDWKPPSKQPPVPKKAETEWNRGIYLGMRQRSNEALICTDSSIRTCRAVRRVPEDQKWNGTGVLAVCWTVPEVIHYEKDPPEEDKLYVPPPVVQPPAAGEEIPEVPEAAYENWYFEDEMEGDDPEPGPDEEIIIDGDDDIPGDEPPSRRRIVGKRPSEPNESGAIDVDHLRMKLRMPPSEEDLRIAVLVLKGVDVTEVFSPARVTEACQRMCMTAGSAMDLTNGRDLTKQSDRNRAVRQVLIEKPWLLIGCPPCTWHSIMQNINKFQHGAEHYERFLELKKIADEHIAFCLKLYKLQDLAGRYYLHEHPQSATSWNLDIMKKFIDTLQPYKVTADQCQYGLITRDGEKTGPAKKPTSFMTNSWHIAQKLQKRCDGSHQHIRLEAGRPKAAAIYPQGLCEAILAGLRNQLVHDASGLAATKLLSYEEVEDIAKDAIDLSKCVEDQHTPGEADEILLKETYAIRQKDGHVAATDDVTGAQLDPELVRQARELEIEWFRKKQVYTKVPRHEAEGYKVVKCRWVDINKGDSVNKEYRSRLVGKEYRDSVDPDLFASTPPLEGLRFVISNAATDQQHKKGKKIIMINDVSRAYFHAKATRTVFVEIPPEDKDPKDGDVVGRLNWCLYGTRDATHNWSETVAEHLVKIGFKRSIAYPAVFHHHQMDIQCIVHGDDFTSCGVEDSLKWFEKELAKVYAIKTKVIGHASNLPSEGRVLNRVLRATDEGWELEADQRHAELVQEALGVDQGKGVVSPGTDGLQEGDQTQLLGPRVQEYRSLTARLNYLSVDRPDLQFAVKELCRSMSCPRELDWLRLVRAAKFLRTRPRLVIKFPWQASSVDIVVHSGANWAGCRESRRSTSGGVIHIGEHLIKSYSKTQMLIALSSAESELYAMVRAAAEALGILSLLKDFGMDKKIRFYVDATAALGVAQRQGIGKIRHLQTNCLWIQEKSITQMIEFIKVHGTQNPADLQTKNVSRELIDKYVQLIGCKYEEGRASSAVQLHSLRRQLRVDNAQFKAYGFQDPRVCALHSMIIGFRDRDMHYASEPDLTSLIDQASLVSSRKHRQAIKHVLKQTIKEEQTITALLTSSQLDSVKSQGGNQSTGQN